MPVRKTLPLTMMCVALMGCATTPIGPSVQGLPGPRKSLDQFQADDLTCKLYAAAQIKSQADAAHQRAVGAALLTTVLGTGAGAGVGALTGNAGGGAEVGAAVGGLAGAVVGVTGSQNDRRGIQAQYDGAFLQCMSAKGEQVPGYARVSTPGDDGVDGIFYVGGAPVAMIEGEQVLLVYDAALGWGYYDLFHHWRRAPDRYWRSMEHDHPAGRGLRGHEDYRFGQPVAARGFSPAARGHPIALGWNSGAGIGSARTPQSRNQNHHS